MKEELAAEKQHRANIIKKKNIEIAGFKKDLDLLLREIETSASSASGEKSRKASSPILLE